MYAAVAAVTMLTIFGGGAQASNNYQMNEVIVTGERIEDALPGGYVSAVGSVGLLGDGHSVMDTPFTQTNLTKKTIENYGETTQALDSILRLDPGVRGGGSHLHNDFSIRGISISGSSIYLNGIPGLIGQFNAPTSFVDRVDITTGPDSILTGVMPTYENSYAGGIVNFVSKKAEEQNITRYKQTFSGHSHLGEYLDIGRRFGRDKQWGVRINTEIRDGETSINGEKITSRGFFANIDHRSNDSKTNLLMGYQNLDVKGGARWFTLYPSAIADGSITKLPDAPKSSRDFGFEGMEKESDVYILALNHEQKLGDNWKVFLNAGYNDSNLSKNITGTSSRYTIINDAGDLMLEWPGRSMYGGVFSTQNYMTQKFIQIGAQGKQKWNDVENTVTIAANKSWIKSDYKMYRPSFGLVAGNLYHGNVSVGDNTFPSFSVQPSDRSEFWGASLVDQLKYKKTQVMIGVHKHIANYHSYSGGKEEYSVKSDAISPIYSFLYKPNDNLSLYFSHSENFDQGTVVSGSYMNENQIIPPAKVKQNEIGMKWINHGFLTTLSLFSIKQANNIDVDKPDGTYYLQDGEQEYKGVEASVTGRIDRKWTGTFGLMYLDAKYKKTQGGILDGTRLNGQANWSSVLALEYDANDNMSLWGRMFYMGRAPINDGAFTVPSYTTFDLGMDYRTKWNDVPVKLTFACYNVTGKDYWMAKSNSLYLSIPRTFALSASFDF